MRKPAWLLWPPKARRSEQIIPELVSYLQGMFIWGHPRSQINVVPNPTMASMIGVLLPLLYNPNLCSDESARRFSEAEVRATAMTAELVGYDRERAGGVFTFGGTGTLLYGVKIGLEKALPGAGRHGLRQTAVDRGLGAKSLLVPERGRLAGHRPGERGAGAHALGQLDRIAGA